MLQLWLQKDLKLSLQRPQLAAVPSVFKNSCWSWGSPWACRLKHAIGWTKLSQRLGTLGVLLWALAIPGLSHRICVAVACTPSAFSFLCLPRGTLGLPGAFSAAGTCWGAHAGIGWKCQGGDRPWSRPQSLTERNWRTNTPASSPQQCQLGSVFCPISYRSPGV